jgi:hypothetical protein
MYYIELILQPQRLVLKLELEQVLQANLWQQL